ncbi:SixA phosphatase family protein [Candidatus Poriferisodalis sp.]|uniref:SixA phosphatase family protein n=1 Tax=Candidatus Poriferisodalis sp. TaxID=3101277 RepID=UPI003B598903
MLYLVRHASAGDRRAWQGDDSVRPLDSKGLTQAAAIAEALFKAPVHRVLSSPSVRCIQTVEPLAAALGLDIGIAVELDEGADGSRTEALLDCLCGLPGDSVLCSHGDAIPEVLWRLAHRGVDITPSRCKKASVWELHVVDGAVTHGVYRPPRLFTAGTS